MMRFGIYTPNYGDFHDPHLMAELAREAEGAGWEGFFISDNLSAEVELPASDAWVLLAGMALATSRIRLGPLVTPLPRQHPGKLAREAVTLDHLSRGRFVQGVGSGDDRWGEYSTFGAAPSDRLRGDMLDEGLEVLTGLWSGEQFSYSGQYYQVRSTRFLPSTVQKPRIPIWVAGGWPNKRPFRRAARWDGVYPNALDRIMMPDDYRAILAFVGERRTLSTPFDVVHAGQLYKLRADQVPEAVAAYREAGVTWWLEDFDWTSSVAEVRARIRMGPPGHGV